MSDGRRFRKKPVEIEAIQWLDNTADVLDFCEGKADLIELVEAGVGIGIDTPEGLMTARLQDWIIKGVQGEFYPCKPEIFDQTYDPV